MAYAKTDLPDTASADEKLLYQSRKGLKEQMEDEGPERDKMKDDLRFCTLDQWPADIRRERENDVQNGPRPCLTIDKINQYIVQVVNDMRQGKPGINVRPQDDSADVDTAKIIKGIIRNIEDQSSADIAYSTGGESAAKIGLGYWRVVPDYISEDSFDQDLFIRPLPNTFGVYLGPHVMPDGSDSKEGWIVESMPVAKFKEEYPGKKWATEDFEDLAENMDHWRTGESVTVCEYYCLERVKEELYFLSDGTTMPKADYDKWPEQAGLKPEIADRRETWREQLKWAKMTGVEVLDKRDLPGKYIPIVEVVGREARIDGKRCLWGLVRPAKDSLRMYNYFASTITEKMGLAPKAPFVGAVGQFATAGEKWRQANRINYAVLEYDAIDVNGNVVPAPARQGATPMEAALLQQMQVIEHDVQTSLGMFKAATGESESQQSGRAILALQRESDTGTYHFGANQAVSIRHTGRILLDLIPHYYDTRRIVRIIGEDGEVQTAQIDPELPVARQEVPGMASIYNPTLGKYDVSITVGPSYNTKRMEAAATFVEMAKGAADPASAAILRYLVMRNSDSSGSDEAAKLLKTMLPPQALQALESKEPIPPQAMAVVQQAQMQVSQMQEGMQKLAQENMQLKANTQTDMVKIQADHQAKMQQLQLEREVAVEEAKLAREKAEAEIAIKRAVAEAEHQIEIEETKHEMMIGEQKMAMEKQKMMDEKMMKIDTDNETEAQKLMPKMNATFEALLKSMESLNQTMQQMVEQNSQGQAAIVAEMKRPKPVRIGSVQRGSAGEIVGANVTVQ